MADLERQRGNGDSAAVQELQHLLNRKGAYPRLLINGVLDDQTEAEIRHFQWTHRLEPNGQVNDKLWTVLKQTPDAPPDPPATRPMLTVGSTHPSVYELQSRLNAKGARPRLEVDGQFQDKTFRAVKQFQWRVSLTAHGTVDQSTWVKLLDGPLPFSVQAGKAWTQSNLALLQTPLLDKDSLQQWLHSDLNAGPPPDPMAVSLAEDEQLEFVSFAPDESVPFVEEADRVEPEALTLNSDLLDLSEMELAPSSELLEGNGEPEFAIDEADLMFDEARFELPPLGDAPPVPADESVLAVAAANQSWIELAELMLAETDSHDSNGGTAPAERAGNGRDRTHPPKPNRDRFGPPAPPPPPVQPITKPEPNRTPPILRRGDREPATLRNGAIHILQHHLQRQIDPTLEVTGNFNEATHEAVVKLQRRHGLIPTGEVNPPTWDLLLQPQLSPGEQATAEAATSAIASSNGTRALTAEQQWVGLPFPNWRGPRTPKGRPYLTPRIVEPPQALKGPVHAIQRLLRANGFADLRVDGRFGRRTLEAIQTFQQRCGLLLNDGHVGDETWERLLESAANHSVTPALDQQASLNLANLCKYYDPQNCPHQTAALLWLERQIPPETLNAFVAYWRHPD